MDKLNYGNYNASISDIAFSSTNGYSDPASELETRKQLSYPLKEVKDFVNNTVTEDSNGDAIQLVLSAEGKLQYRTSPDGELIDIGGGIDIDTIYPVGSIFMSINNTDPSTLFPDTTWVLLSSVILKSENIVGNGKALGLTDGSKKGGFGNNYTGSANFGTLFTGNYGASAGSGNSGNQLDASKALGIPTNSQLGGHPEYSGIIAQTETVYTWKRTA